MFYARTAALIVYINDLLYYLFLKKDCYADDTFLRSLLDYFTLNMSHVVDKVKCTQNNLMLNKFQKIFMH